MRTLLHFAQDGDTSGFFPQLARWHDRSRYRMLFATLRPMAPELREYMATQGVPTFSCEARSRVAYPLALVRFLRHLRREGVDILHTHLFDPSVVGLIAGTLAGVPRRVTTRHYSDYHTRIHKTWHVRLDQLCTRLSHAVIAVSRHTADHIVRMEGAPPAKVHAIVNGIDFDRVRLSSPEAPQRIRRELAPDGAHLLLIAARLHPEKGYEQLFRAMTELARLVTHPVRLLVAGTGTLQPTYERMVADLGCADRVRFLGFRRDVTDLMAAVEAVVLPSLAEAFGLALAEALYLGVPVVATRVGGIPEIVDHGLDGLLVPPGDSHALAEAIAALLNDPELRRRLSGSGRETVAARFRFEDMMRRYEAVYEQADAPTPGADA